MCERPVHRQGQDHACQNKAVWEINPGRGGWRACGQHLNQMLDVLGSKKYTVVKVAAN